MCAAKNPVDLNRDVSRSNAWAMKLQTERGGFEPPVPFLIHSISSAAQSATLPPLQILQACKPEGTIRLRQLLQQQLFQPYAVSRLLRELRELQQRSGDA